MLHKSPADEETVPITDLWIPFELAEEVKKPSAKRDIALNFNEEYFSHSGKKYED